MAERKSRLGAASVALINRRGADALASLAADPEPGISELANAILLDITRISTSPNQPRKTLDQEALQELADSIRERGILQPIVVRRNGDRFVIVAGERRYRAALLVGLEQVPAILREASDDEAIEQSLIENLQRENIDPVEEASSFHELMRLHRYSIRDLAARVHKSHAYVAERLQLIKYPELAEAVAAGQVSAKAASELARVDDPALRRELLGRVRSGELDSRHIRRVKRGEPPMRAPAISFHAILPVGTAAPDRTAETVEAPSRPTEALGREIATPPAPAAASLLPRDDRSGTQDDITFDPASRPDQGVASLPPAKSAVAASRAGDIQSALDAIETARRVLAALDVATIATERRDAVATRLRDLADQIAALLERLGAA